MIDRESGIPYYRQLMDLLRKQIDTGLLQEGQQIPSEAEMSETYRVNRHTVRQAVSELCRLGELYKIRGRGTFVAKALLDTIEYQLSAKNRFTENVKKLGGTPGTKILQAMEITAPEKVRRLLELQPEETVYFYYAQRFINDRPFVVGQSFLPAKYFPDALPYLSTLQSKSEFYGRYNVICQRTKSTIRAAFPSKEETLLLDIPGNMPVLKVEKLMKSQAGILIEYGVSCYRGDLAKLSVSW